MSYIVYLRDRNTGRFRQCATRDELEGAKNFAKSVSSRGFETFLFRGSAILASFKNGKIVKAKG